MIALIYNVGSGNGFSVREVIEAARRITGHPIPVRESPRRPGDPPRLVASSDKIRRELGWHPLHVDLEDMISSAWEWHRSHPEGIWQFMTFIIVLLGWVFSLCVHEFSHAAVAYAGGDTTVREKGYLTFNPLKYTHPVYSLLLPLLFLALGGIGLPGGAVYIETWRLRSRRWISAVSLAGPASNLILAILLGYPA